MNENRTPLDSDCNCLQCRLTAIHNLVTSLILEVRDDKVSIPLSDAATALTRAILADSANHFGKSLYE